MTEKHEVVLSLHSNQVPDLGQVLFTEDNPEAGQHPETYYVSEKDWEAMGEPEVITLTFVAGDQLNPPDDGAELLHRDAGTGQFVTEKYAEEHPDTTVTES